MPRKTINTRLCEQKPPASGRTEILDTKLPGFRLRISAARPGREDGTKTFGIVYRIHGQQRRMTIGNWPTFSASEARQKAREALQKVEDGIDPANEKAAAKATAPTTFGQMVEEYIEEFQKKEKKNKSYWQTEARLRKLTDWWGRPAESIKKPDVRAALKEITDRGAMIEANRMLASIRGLFMWAVGEDYLENSPCYGIRPPGGKEKPRKRTLEDDELLACWQAAGDIGWPFGHVTRLIIATGQRPGTHNSPGGIRNEVGGMRWPDLDINGDKLWKIPPNLLKTDIPHAVPLNEIAIEVLESCPRFEGDLVFASSRKPKKGDVQRAVSGYSKGKARLDEAMKKRLRAIRGLAEDAEIQIERYTFHDLRRTVRTNLSRLKVPSDHAELVIGHKPPKIQRIYDWWEYLDEKRHALDIWGSFLRALVDKPPENVVAIRAAG